MSLDTYCVLNFSKWLVFSIYTFTGITCGIVNRSLVLGAGCSLICSLMIAFFISKINWIF